MSGLINAWSLITHLRWEDHAHLAPWHLWAVLLVLTGLAGFGLHYVFGSAFRFYWRAGRFQWWIAILAFPVLMVSSYALIWTYVLATGAPRLTDRLLHDEEEGKPALTTEIGAYLLRPAFQHARIEPGAPGPTAQALTAALAAIPAEDLRIALGAEKEEPPEEEAPAEARGEQAPASEPPPGEAQGGAAGPPIVPGPAEAPAPAGSGTMVSGGSSVDERGPVPVILAIVSEWITDPEQSWPDVQPVESERPAGKEAGSPLTAADFIASLVREIPPGSALPEPDWAYIAGQRFEERLLGPMLLEYLQMSALAVAILILLLNVGYFWVISRMNRPPRLAKVKAEPPPPSVEAPKREAEGA